MKNNLTKFKQTYYRVVRPTKRLISRTLFSSMFRSLVTEKKFWVVAFHRVDDLESPDPLTCGITEFEKYCEFLSRHFQIVPLAEQLTSIDNPKVGGTLSITFDDGYRDNHDQAAPILDRLGLPATFFVTTGFIGTDQLTWWDRPLPKKPEWMTWDHVRSLHSRGYDIGCHTVTHADFGTISVEQAKREIIESLNHLESELKSQVNLFAYPYGGVQNMTAENLKFIRSSALCCSLSCYGGVNQIGADPFKLNRIPINSARGESVTDLGYHLIRNLRSGNRSVTH
ncbi:hypothetical protein CKO25_09410 [Thiocapsa imhoffii]|uniref:NodB homology domain-containing protein n=1 Tax=Thiocapsa imhoffii TaxID=382777 RepID=A0A9X0WHZ2_9GAMM|nr:polysaccharide deacetylase family protein [Thiocapsa imhoffii]MBK1644861.1 hypothetical protein [Thiocapsa imhoffii]